MKVYLESFGCSASQASGEIMKAAVERLGHELLCSGEAEKAEVYICNSCTVKYTTEQKILYKIRSMGEKGLEVVVSGCMPEVQLDDILHANPEAHILGVNAVSRLGDLLASIEQRKKEGLLAGRLEIRTSEPLGFLNVPRERSNPNIHICQISQGCNFACSYCIVRHARGKLQSFPPEAIVEDIRSAVAEGCREIWLTSQDDSQYGMDTGFKLPELLRLISEIPGDFKVRVGMMNPFSVLPILDDLVDAFDSDKIFKLLHLPIQSASHSVLKRMNRLHKMDAVDTIITKFRSRFDDLSLFTDIIVGFCDETDEDFEETVEWVKKYRPEKVNISRYSPRPHTKAFTFRNLDSRIPVQRSHDLHKVCEQIKLGSKQQMIGWKGRVFVSKYTELGDVLTRTDSYRPVVISGSNLKPGEYASVEITAAKPGYFLGKLLEE
ncbi:tRNA (N(6)-L-threonylcarbamoyladenosine(37)-C(2))-methylthiotransferase [Methanosarcina sp. KYL-1]|uniref:tRNA (N(6)-L-threonylcarbamoyladenosine(37)-C(2))- methylthiotransferase n=1 Tax=Methanosarcina sp. KYL-1 TaxID=2602068 RepID=UPI002101BCE7|nr:tRNA (N(6)-L-threonylcarbamoyladenosine(37)-C(2))-methylthiotransferase [Methanosarcina sp. KYL-1]MCQ1536927.1 tRNA (N(6)-L-threonylcarbamoyladenosine(37)-C(2))-methylthiotransferase [Methanosarcina sp. KYL-1]